MRRCRGTAIIREGPRPAETSTEEHTVTFEPGSESLVEVVVTSVARMRDVEPNELPPLGRSFDVELLERLVRPAVRGRAESGHVTFPYAGVLVTVDIEGAIRFEWE